MPGDSAPAWLGSQPCLVDEVSLQTLLFCASNVATLPVKRGSILRCVYSVSKGGSEGKRHKAVALIGGEVRWRGRDQRLLHFLIKTKHHCTMGFCHCSLPFLGSVVGLYSWACLVGLQKRKSFLVCSDNCFAAPPPYKTFGLFKKLCPFRWICSCWALGCADSLDPLLEPER